MLGGVKRVLVGIRRIVYVRACYERSYEVIRDALRGENV